MNALDAFVAGRAPAYEGDTHWGPEVHLAVRIYPCAEVPPVELVTSVRAVLFKGARVMVVDDHVETHIMPGGRIEPGETIAQTLDRELREECGWTIREPKLFGMVHFRHVKPKPDGYRYPYPDFLHLLFVGEAGAYDRRGLKREGEIETASRMVPISQAMAMLSLEQRTILAAAQAARRA